MPLNLDKKKTKSNKMNSVSDIMSDFACLKVSALQKASLISSISYASANDRITIGPQSALDKDDSDKLKNIENEQNSCNIKTPPKTSSSSPKYNTVTTSNGITFSMKKILLESELQRQEEVRKNIQRHVQNMEKNDRAILAQLAHTRSSMARERERQSAEKLASILAEEERIAEQEEIKRQHEQQLQAQRLQEQIEKNKRELEEYRRRMREKEEVTKAVMAHRAQFTSKYCDIAALSKACKDKHALNVVLTANSPRLKELIQQFEALDEKIKSGELVATDMSIIETLDHHMNDMLNIFRTEIEKIDAQYEAELARKAQAANEVQQVVATEAVNATLPDQPDGSGAVENKEAQDQHSAVMTNQAATSVINVPVAPCTSEPKSEEATQNSKCKTGHSIEYVDEESLQIYLRSRHFLATYRAAYKDFLESPATKKFRFECQKAINIPVNAISAISEEHLRDKYDRLQNLLNGKFANVMQHAQGVFFCKDHLAKKIVNQGETLVSSKPEMAFPVAAIVVALWNEHTDFGELFLAHLHEACPFTVPIFMLQQEGQSNEDYCKSLGYKYSEDGTLEQQDKFLKRMSGLMRLYASITVTGQRRGVTKSHPHSLQYAWRWLAAVLNIEPRIDTCNLCATLILDMLEVTGNMLWTAYPKQFHKLLMLLKEQYFLRVQNVASGGSGPLVRLDDFLSNALTSGTIRPADGLLPPNFW
ncbi:Nucleoporin GLE1 [Ooceraea biroi]|uniref:mRNA export factor GLE1 n=1 Tax=Ooceraea biroi TaxID=2015173 RepID=A0A026W379_OOCBI|nr:Nucleoporin GLE1 [Ooceraea biroi]